TFKELIEPSVSPLVDVRLRFAAGAADDPPGKAGLAQLTALMVADAGSRAMTYEAIQQALFPMAAGFGAGVDKEMTTFGGKVHRDNLGRWYDIIGGQLLDPGFRQEDFTRVRSNLVNGIRVGLRANNDEELGNEVLYERLYAGHPYGHLTSGHAPSVEALSLDDVRGFHRTHYTQANLVLGLAGSAEAPLLARMRSDLAAHLPAGPPARRRIAPARPLKGLDVTLVQKDVRAAAISMGFPITVRRGDPDFIALYLARSYLGEHRNSASHLYQRMREIRGMNYGDYAYVEYFPGGMFVSSPRPGVARSQQAFRIWVRPVPIEQTHFALRIAKYELDKLVREGVGQEDFDLTRSFLTKQAGLLTARQGDRLGYNLDEAFYGAPEFVRYIRSGLAGLTRAQVNAAVRRHLGSPNMAVVVVTPEAQALKAALVANSPSPIKYASEKPAEILAEDRLIERYPLSITADSVRIVPVGEVFEKPLFG
ncbi:MAG: peptidase domain protein, partial [Caulobacteraceae bacterium]|nr:peptidase domain protein [Caulobacteraceae bacterium]